MSNAADPGYRLDEIDRRIIHALMADARNTSAPMIAEQVNVSPGTIRNRIDRLEAHGVIRGYTTSVDFERAEASLTNLYLCSVPVVEREALAREAGTIPGVINVRELMTGRRNLHVLAVGEDTDDLQRIARALATVGIDIEDEELVQNESFEPYAPYGPDRRDQTRRPTDFISLAGDADVIEVTVRAGAPIADLSLETAVERGVLDEETLVVAIERGGRTLTPHGETVVEPDDVVTLLSRGGAGEMALDSFTGTDETTAPER